MERLRRTAHASELNSAQRAAKASREITGKTLAEWEAIWAHNARRYIRNGTLTHDRILTGKDLLHFTRMCGLDVDDTEAVETPHGVGYRVTKHFLTRSRG